VVRPVTTRATSVTEELDDVRAMRLRRRLGLGQELAGEPDARVIALFLRQVGRPAEVGEGDGRRVARHDVADAVASHLRFRRADPHGHECRLHVTSVARDDQLLGQVDEHPTVLGHPPARLGIDVRHRLELGRRHEVFVRAHARDDDALHALPIVACDADAGLLVTEATRELDDEAQDPRFVRPDRRIGSTPWEAARQSDPGQHLGIDPEIGCQLRMGLVWRSDGMREDQVDVAEPDHP